MEDVDVDSVGDVAVVCRYCELLIMWYQKFYVYRV